MGATRAALTGVNADDQVGDSVDLSADGTILAVGSIYNDDNGSDSGHVLAFQFNSNSNDWEFLGEAIPGVAEGDYFGISVALLSNGMVLAAGAYLNDDNGFNSGHVRVFDYSTSSNQWIQRGSAIAGVAVSDSFGWSVALSADGNQLAAGAVFNDDVADRSGHVRVFRYEESSGGGTSTGQWKQVGEPLTGVGGQQDYLGRSVAMSADGTVVAGGAEESNDAFFGPWLCLRVRGSGGVVWLFARPATATQEHFCQESRDPFVESSNDGEQTIYKPYLYYSNTWILYHCILSFVVYSNCRDLSLFKNAHTVLYCSLQATPLVDYPSMQLQYLCVVY